MLSTEHAAHPGLQHYCLHRRSLFYPKTDLAVADEVLGSLRVTREAMPALNPETVARVCTELFGQRPASVARLAGQGTFHALYRISFGPADACVLRANVLPDLGHAYEFLIDRWITDLLQSHGLPSLAVRHVDLSREVFPFDYEILDEAKGKPLHRDEITIRGLVYELGRTIARVHGIEAEGFGLLDVRSVVTHPGAPGKGLQRNWQEHIMLNLEDHLRICCSIGAINAEESLKIAKCFDSGAPLMKDVSSSLLHGDLGHHNVFSDGTLITAIIDWEDCLCGDPVFDIAYWGTFHHDGLLTPFLHGYREARRVPDDFEERYWLYYLRIALAKTVHRYRFQYKDAPGRAPASLRIQKALSRVAALGFRESR